MSGPYNLKYIHLFVTEVSPGAKDLPEASASDPGVAVPSGPPVSQTDEALAEPAAEAHEAQAAPQPQRPSKRDEQGQDEDDVERGHS